MRTLRDGLGGGALSDVSRDGVGEGARLGALREEDGVGDGARLGSIDSVDPEASISNGRSPLSLFRTGSGSATSATSVSRTSSKA